MKWPLWCVKTRNRHPGGNSRGWALLEMLLVLPVLLLIAGILFMLLGHGIRAFGQVAKLEEEQYFARSAMQMINDDVVQARQASICNDGRGLDLIYADGSSRRYFFSEGQIFRISADSVLPLTENTSGLGFSLPSAAVVRTEIIQGTGPDVFRLQSAVKLGCE